MPQLRPTVKVSNIPLFYSWNKIAECFVFKTKCTALFKGTVSIFFLQKLTELGLSKGRGWFKKLVLGSNDFIMKKGIYCG